MSEKLQKVRDNLDYQDYRNTQKALEATSGAYLEGNLGGRVPKADLVVEDLRFAKDIDELDQKMTFYKSMRDKNGRVRVDGKFAKVDAWIEKNITGIATEDLTERAKEANDAGNTMLASMLREEYESRKPHSKELARRMIATVGGFATRLVLGVKKTAVGLNNRFRYGGDGTGEAVDYPEAEAESTRDSLKDYLAEKDYGHKITGAIGGFATRAATGVKNTAGSIKDRFRTIREDSEIIIEVDDTEEVLESAPKHLKRADERIVEETEEDDSTWFERAKEKFGSKDYVSSLKTRLASFEPRSVFSRSRDWLNENDDRKIAAAIVVGASIVGLYALIRKGYDWDGLGDGIITGDKEFGAKEIIDSVPLGPEPVVPGVSEAVGHPEVLSVENGEGWIQWMERMNPDEYSRQELMNTFAEHRDEIVELWNAQNAIDPSNPDLIPMNVGGGFGISRPDATFNVAPDFLDKMNAFVGK